MKGYKCCDYCGEPFDATTLNEIQVPPLYADGGSGPVLSAWICDACEIHVAITEDEKEGLGEDAK